MSKVFEESVLAGMKLANRIIRSATHEGMADQNGKPKAELVKLYSKLVRGGVGAIITGYVAIQENGRTLSNMALFDKDESVEDFSKLVKSVKESGIPLILQLAHGGGQIDPELVKQEAIAPSRLKYPLNDVVARKMSDTEIKEVISNFIKAISRAKKAGFDGVQIHAAHGYLLFSFLSPQCNKRNDKWGGDTKGRFRIIDEILQGARQEVGSYPILIKISAFDSARNGMTVNEAIKIAEMFEDAGGDAIEISSGGINLGFRSVRMVKPPIDAIFNLHHRYRSKSAVSKKILAAFMPLVLKPSGPLHNYNVAAAAEIKNRVNIPVIVVGGIRNLADMECILEKGKADYISLCRPLIIEPDFVNNLKVGKRDRSKCIDCGYCLIAATA